MNGGEEVAGGLVIAGCDGAELLEFGEEVLDQMPCLVEIAVIVTGRLASLSRRDHCGFAGRLQGLDHTLLGIEPLIAEDRAGLHLRQQVVSAHQVMRLAAGQVDTGRVAESIDGGVDFRAQPAARAPDRLVLAGFFLAPALC